MTPPPPAYFYDGENYLVKMTSDLDWLDSLEPLRACIGTEFPLIRNPFVLAGELREIVESDLLPRSTESTLSLKCVRNGLLMPMASFKTQNVNHASLCLPPTAMTLPGACDIMDNPSVMSCAPTCSRGDRQTTKIVATSFGNPTDVVTRHTQGTLTSWKGKIQLGSRFEVRFCVLCLLGVS